MTEAKRYQGRIYMVVNDIDNNAFIGSTTQRLCVRMGQHRRYARAGSDNPLYHHMRKLGVERFKIYLIRYLDNCTKEELKAYEHRYTSQLTTEQKNEIVTAMDKKKPTKTSRICEHNKGRYKCKHCSPFFCEYCNKTYGGKSNYKRHVATKTHKKNKINYNSPRQH
jgi:hypothetical protein